MSGAFDIPVAGLPGEDNALLSSLLWIQAVLLGSVATTIAVIAIASVGFLMLSGRMNVKRGGVVILGCFILFGAANIAQALRAMAGDPTTDLAVAEVSAPPALAEVLASVPAPDVPPEDPYAGAALRR